jgi:hypothetical protein
MIAIDCSRMLYYDTGMERRVSHPNRKAATLMKLDSAASVSFNSHSSVLEIYRRASAEAKPDKSN